MYTFVENNIEGSRDIQLSNDVTWLSWLSMDHLPWMCRGQARKKINCMPRRHKVAGSPHRSPHHSSLKRESQTRSRTFYVMPSGARPLRGQTRLRRERRAPDPSNAPQHISTFCKSGMAMEATKAKGSLLAALQAAS